MNTWLDNTFCLGGTRTKHWCASTCGSRWLACFPSDIKALNPQHIFLRFTESCRGTVSCQITSPAWWDQLQTQLLTLHCSFPKTYALELKTKGWKWWRKPKQTTAFVTKSEVRVSSPWGLNPCLWITRDLNTDPISGQQDNRMCMGGPAILNLGRTLIPELPLTCWNARQAVTHYNTESMLSDHFELQQEFSSDNYLPCHLCSSKKRD